MKELPKGCVHRTVPDLPHVTHEWANLGMKVVYRPAAGRPSVGVLQRVNDSGRDGFVLFLGDRVAKLVKLEDLHYWDGIQ